MNSSKKIIAVTVLIFALYLWYKRFDVFTHPEYYGELILPLLLTVAGIYLLIKKPKKQ